MRLTFHGGLILVAICAAVEAKTLSYSSELVQSHESEALAQTDIASETAVMALINQEKDADKKKREEKEKREAEEKKKKQEEEEKRKKEIAKEKKRKKRRK